MPREKFQTKKLTKKMMRGFPNSDIDRKSPEQIDRIISFLASNEVITPEIEREMKKAMSKKIAEAETRGRMNQYYHKR